MMLALGAAGSLLDALQSLMSPKSPSGTASANQSQGAADQSQGAANPFDLGSSTQTQSSATTGMTGQSSGWASISPQTMSALIDAQSQSGTTNSAPTNPADALKDLFSQIDADGNGAIDKSEFENALGAGGTNLAAADDVFSKLDTNGDGSVSLDEMKSALQGAGGHHGHHHHMPAATSGDGSSDPNADPLMQALSGASSTSVTNSDGSTTTSITYADGSTVSLTTPAASASTGSSASSSYNWIEQMIQREAKTLSASVASSLSVSV
jgi:Ca2+-binding EF-hand superfamily protein